MISLVLALALAWSFYIGYSRGLILQIFYAVGTVVSLMVATTYYQKLAAVFYLWIPFANATEGAKTYYFADKYLFDLDQVFYAGLAFLCIFTASYLVVRFLGIFMHFFQAAGPVGTLYYVLSGIVSMVVTLIALNMVLTVAAAIPLATVQDALQGSWLANAIIRYTPVMTGLLKNLWVTTVLG